MNTIHINTSNIDKTIVEISGTVSDQMTVDRSYRSPQVVIAIISELLTKNNLTVDNITEISVHTGPGSFTGLRVGVAIANALAFAMKIPINGKDIDQYVEPQYT